MVTLAAIRRVEVQGSAKGLDTLERSLKAVGAAQEGVARTGEVVTRTMEKTERRQLSLAGSFSRVRNDLDATYRAQEKFARYQNVIDQTFRQGAVGAQEYERQMELLRSKYDVAGIAAQKAAARVHELRMRFDEGYAAAQRMEAELSELAEAERAGVQITGGYSAALDALALKHDKAAQAAARQVEELRALANAEKLAATQADGQSRWNSYAGVGKNNAGAARESAAVFEAAAREADELAAKASRLRAELDPVAAAQDRLNAELAEFSTLAKAGAISAGELEQAQKLAHGRYEETERALKGVSDGTANAAYQMRNLRFQLFDVGQSLAGGMPVWMVLMQQGPQIAQIYGPEEGGIGRAFRETGREAARLTRLLWPIAAVAAVGAAGIAGMTYEINKLSSVKVTFGDVFKASVEVLVDALYDDLKPAIDAVSPWFAAAWNNVIAATKLVGNLIINSFRAAFADIKFVWQQLPNAIGGAVVGAANAAINAIGNMIQNAADMLDSFIDKANSALSMLPGGLSIDKIGKLDFGRFNIDNPYAKDLDNALKQRNQQLEQIMGSDPLGKFFNDVTVKAIENANERLGKTKEATKAAEDAARDAAQAFEAFANQANGLVEKYFPGESARREAEELTALLQRYGAGLDDIQRKSVELRIADQFEAARLGVRELDRTTKNSAESMAQSVEQTLGSVLGDLFSKPMRDLDAFIESVMSQFAQLGQANLQKVFDGLFSGSGSSGAGTSSRSGGLFGQIAEFVGGIFGNSKVTSAQNRAINTAASQISVKPLVSAMGEIGNAVSRTTSTLGSSMSQYANAIKSIESSGNYGALGPVTARGDRAYGAYQVMGNNIPSWTKELLGYSISATDFLKSRSIQDAVFQQQFKKSIDKFGNFSDAASVWFSGQPLSVSRNRSDGFNTVEQYVRKANAALASPGAITSAVEAGTKNGLTAIASAGANVGAGAGAGDPWAGLRQATAPGVASSGSTGAMGGFGNIAGAALGGLGMGFQSQNPVMGALGGALSGLAAGPVGAVVGGIAGIIGGLFGRSRAKKQEQSQARNQLNANRTLLAQLFAAGDGRGTGSGTQAYNDFYDRTAEIDLVAQKAGDDELVQKLRNNVNKFFLILEKDFIAKFPGIADAYASGYGSDSPFMQGVSAMEDLREELKNFVADARDFGELQLKHARDLTPEQLEERVAEAERAAQKMVLASITGVDELSTMEGEMLRLDGAASVARQTLEQLGMAADEAAKAVDQALTTAIAKMRDTFMKDITASISALSGVGYLNDILDAQEAYQERLRDSTALGLDGSYALRELSLTLKDIVVGADLSQQEIDKLSLAFPQLQFALQGWSKETLTLADATTQLQSAYDAEYAAKQDAITQSKSMIASIKQFRESMRVNDSSPLGPKERLDEAAKQFREIAALAAGGDETAQGRLTTISQQYLDEARSYYASSEDYFKIWQEVDRTLAQTQATAESNLTAAERQLSALEASVAGILNVDKSVISVREALAQYALLQTASLDTLAAQIGMIGTNAITEAYHSTMGRDPDSAGLAWWQSQVAGGKSIDWVSAAIGNSPEARIRALYQQILGRDVDQSSLGYWMQSGKSYEEIAADLKYAKSNGGMRLGGIVGGYASGGIVGNGLYDIDSVRARYAGGGDIALAGGEHVTRATSVTSDTYPALAYINRTGRLPSNDDGKETATAIRQEMQALRGQIAVLTKALAGGMEAQIKLASESNATQSEMVGSLRKVASKL